MFFILSPTKFVASMDLRAQEFQGSMVGCGPQGTCGVGPYKYLCNVDGFWLRVLDLCF